MSKAEWGTKRICQSCGAKFYDLQKDPIVCPKCGTTFDPEVLTRSKRRPAAEAKPKAKALAKVVPVEPDAEDAEVAEEDEDILEDTSELGEDDEDIDDVVEAVEEGGDED